MYTLELVQEGHAPHAILLTDSPVLIGRAPSNDLMVSDDQVSWHHAAVWLESGVLHIRDMGSRNGTLLNGSRIKGLGRFGPGDAVNLGPTTQLRVTAQGGGSAVSVALLLEEVDSGIRLPLRSDRFHIGSAADADFRIEGPERAATLLVESDGSVVLATDDSSLSLVRGQQFEVAGRRLRVVEVPHTVVPTVEPDGDRYPYSLRATLNGAVGPEALIEDLRHGTQYKVEAENRAILLYLLARKASEDQGEGVALEDAGWATDDEISVGVWGRGGPADANNLHVLVYRLRKELKRAGFDPWFIEKRRRALRVRLKRVTVD
jgi:pSer/pThr/pTyr-binding forkhead associated (FHA) protein